MTLSSKNKWEFLYCRVNKKHKSLWSLVIITELHQKPVLVFLFTYYLFFLNFRFLLVEFKFLISNFLCIRQTIWFYFYYVDILKVFKIKPQRPCNKHVVYFSLIIHFFFFCHYRINVKTIFYLVGS